MREAFGCGGRDGEGEALAEAAECGFGTVVCGYSDQLDLCQSAGLELVQQVVVYHRSS